MADFQGHLVPKLLFDTQAQAPQVGVTVPAPLPAGRLGLRVFTLRNADATKVAKVLTDFLQEPNRPLVVSVYKETNTLLVQASPADLELIELLIARLERPPR